MGYVRKMAFQNARANLFSKVGLDMQHFSTWFIFIFEFL